MFFQNVRRNKEGILYFILTILCLEYVRIRYNKLEDISRREQWRGELLRNRQKWLITKAGMVYGVFFAFFVLNFSISLTYKITNTYSNATILKSNIALIANVVLSYIFSVIVVRILLRQYIKRMNGFTRFWKKLGISAWDGTKVVLKTPGKVGGAVKNTVYTGAKKGMRQIKKTGGKGVRLATSGTIYVVEKTGKVIKIIGKSFRNALMGLFNRHGHKESKH